jgi:hypothetical protein
MHSLKAAWWTAITVFVLIILGLTPSGPAEAQQGQWIAAWGSSMQGLSSGTLTNVTVQMIARPTIAGDALRVRIENTFSSQPLTIGAASIALRNYRASLVAGSIRPLTFKGLPSVTISAKGWVLSDPVAFAVEAQQDLAVSLYLPGTNVPVTRHTSAYTTSYLTPNGAGNLTASENRSAFTSTKTDTYWLSAIEVYSSAATGALVALGDSITNGTCSTTDAHNRWEDLLAVRLLLAGTETAVVNAGISGNKLSHAKQRLDRDVLQQVGVTHVVLFIGTNDIEGGRARRR